MTYDYMYGVGLVDPAYTLILVGLFLSFLQCESHFYYTTNT